MIYLINTLNQSVQTGGNIFNIEFVSKMISIGIEVIYLSGKPILQLLQHIPNNSTVLVDSICLNDVEFDWSALDKYNSFVLLHMAPSESISLTDIEQKYLANAEKYVFSRYPILALGHASIRYIEEKYKLKTRYILIPIFRNDTIVKFQYSHLPSKFISVGSICKDKGTELLIKSLSKLKSRTWTCNFYGAIKSQTYYNKCLTLIHKYKLNQQIYFNDLVPQKILHQEYCSSDLLIHTSLHENSSIAIMDAILIGLPFVTTPTGDFEKYKDINVGMISESFSTKRISEKIKDAIVNYPNLIVNTKWAREVYKKEIENSSFEELKNILI